MPLAQC
jgi:hypothetical protein